MKHATQKAASAHNLKKKQKEIHFQQEGEHAKRRKTNALEYEVERKSKLIFQKWKVLRRILGEACKCGSFSSFQAHSSHYRLLAPVYIKQPPLLFWATDLIEL